MIDEGVIKFSTLKSSNHFNFPEKSYHEINSARDLLHQYSLIGEYSDIKIGYGNISLRANQDNFYISASQTGNISSLLLKHYVLIEEFSFERNSVSFSGTLKPSSETLTHAAIYTISEEINAVIHVHNRKLWNHLIAINHPATPKDTPYGTIEMANEVKAISGSSEHFSFVMKGHEDGIVIFSTTMKRALEETLSLFRAIE